MHTLEVLDAVGNRKYREPAHEVERTTHGGVADSVDRTGDAGCSRRNHRITRLGFACNGHSSITATGVKLEHPGRTTPKAAIQKHLHAPERQPFGTLPAPHPTLD